MKIIDAFIFFNEIDLLKLRLFYLADIVDHFVICESDTTFSGVPKPYYLDEFIDSLPEEIVSKIIRIKVTEKELLQEKPLQYINIEAIPDFNTKIEWRRERLQRNALTSITSKFSPDDFFILGDVDEFPKIEVIQMWAKIISHLKGTQFVYVLHQTTFYYNFCTYSSDDTAGSIFSNIRTLKEVGCDLLRYQRAFKTPLKEAGWHFSYVGDLNFIKNKINCFSHQELNISEYTEDTNIVDAVSQQQDLYNPTNKYLNYEFEEFPNNLKSIIKDIFPLEFYTNPKPIPIVYPGTTVITNVDPMLDTFLAGIFNFHKES
jgi:beta-1,4-mannosyl-glycoprotein beta-1,4-N-acetylglucosaminyltransferase